MKIDLDPTNSSRPIPHSEPMSWRKISISAHLPRRNDPGWTKLLAVIQRSGRIPAKVHYLARACPSQ